MAGAPRRSSPTHCALERDGLLVGRAYAEIPPRVEYELAPLGHTLREPLAAIRAWAEAHIHESIDERERRDENHDDERRKNIGAPSYVMKSWGRAGSRQ
jgi:hypothetical protein